MYRILTNATANGVSIWCTKGFRPYDIAVCIHPKTGAPFSAIRWELKVN